MKRIKSGETIELQFSLAGGLYSRHELWIEGGMIHDFSCVDSSEYFCTEKEYRSSFYGKAFKKQSVKLMENEDMMKIDWALVLRGAEVILRTIRCRGPRQFPTLG